MFYSVIIPVYNEEKYLKDCIDSILRFPNQNFEILAINDGSSDNSLNILKSYNDPRLIIIDQENMGQYRSWKKAVLKAKGDYIIFVDSDDLLEANIFDYSDEILSKNNVDIIQYRYQSKYPNSIEEYQFDRIHKGLYTKAELLNYDNIYNSDFIVLPKERWAKCIKKDSLMFVVNNSVEYLDNFEDVATMYVLYKNIDSLYVSNDIVYSWRKLKGSSNTTKKEYLDKNFNNIINLNNYFEENKDLLNLTQIDIDYLYFITYRNYYYFYAFFGYYKESKKIYKIKKFRHLLHKSYLPATKGNKLAKLLFHISNFFMKHNFMHTYIFIRKMYLKKNKM